MPTPLDSPQSTSIFEHYSGFDTTASQGRRPDFTHLRRGSEFSTLSSNASSTNHHVNVSQGGGHHESILGANSPQIAPSVKSSSSSLRHTVAMLKAGVFPPGIQQRRARADSDSDASHYDDDEIAGIDGVEGNGLFTSGTPMSVTGSQQYRNRNLDEIEVYSNAPDSPFVPRRVSSVSSVEPKDRRGSLKRSSPAEESTAELTRSRNNSLITDQEAFNRRENSMPSPPYISPNLHKAKVGSPDGKAKSPSSNVDALGSRAMETTLSDSSSALLSPTKEKELERQLASSTDNEDPNRPRTLKEARALAKERAQQRLQARQASDLTITSPRSASPTKTQPLERPRRDPKRESYQSDRSAASHWSGNSGEEREGKASKDSSDWKGHSRQRATPVTPGDERGSGQLASASSQDVRQTLMQSTSSTMAMEDLQSAVGEAIQDVSFSSTATASTATPFIGSDSAENDQQTSKINLDIPVQGEGEGGSSIHSKTSFDSARESMGLSSAVSFAVPSWAAPDVPRSVSEEQSPTTNVISTFTATQIPSLPAQVALTSASPIVDANPASTFVPHTLHAQQRSTAPNKIARLDVYGKTIPWPPAFNPAAIIEQRRLAPWERARSYAHYCNDLTDTASGLSVWIEMVQRPAQRIVPEPATPLRRHNRGEGTEGSTYAASIRSDATFPVRGDGGRAKELMSSMPATINESPPSTLPNNIPYPSLVQQPSRTSSSSQDDVASSMTATSDRDRSNSTGRSGNFFSSLGRKGSSRRTPGSGSMTGFSPLNSNSNAPVRGAMRGKTKTISNPMNLTSSPSLLNIKSSNDSDAMSSSPSPNPTTPRNQIPSSPSHGTQLSRMPLGPRAPTSSSISGSLPLLSVVGSRRLSATHVVEKDRVTPFGLSTTGGIYSVPASNNSAVHVISGSPTDYSGESSAKVPASLPLGTVKSSFQYNSVRDKSPNRNYATATPSLQPPTVPSRNSSEGHGSKSRRGSNQQHPVTPAENEALDKLADVLPDAERSTLLEYLRRANGNDLIAIGDYLQAQAKSEGKQFMR